MECTTLATGQTPVASAAEWTPVVVVLDAQYAQAWSARIKGENINWRVIADGVAGPEVVASGVIPAGPLAFARPTIPGPLAAGRLRLEAQLTAAGAAVSVSGEVNWVLMYGAPSPRQSR